MDCHEARQWLDADDVPAEVAREVAAHRRVCGDCDRALAASEGMMRAVEELPVPTLPDEYWEAYASRLGERLARTDGISARPKPARRVALASALAAAAVLVLAVGLRPLFRGKPDDASPHDASPANRELALIEDKIRRTENRINTMLAAQRRTRLSRRLQQLAGRPTPIEAVNRQLDRAALVSVYRADQLAADRRSRVEAIRAYRMVVKHFPRTHWADVAKARLEALESPKGGMNDENPHDTDNLLGCRPGSGPLCGTGNHPC